MFRMLPREIERLQASGGERLTEFADHLIRAEARTNGVTGADVETNLKTTRRDGGVDTVVRQPVPGDKTGYLGERTAWQYKGTDFSNVKWGKILDGPYVRQLINEGFALRVVVADGVDSATRQRQEAELFTAVRVLNADAPTPRILTSGELADWATSMPFIVLHHQLGRLAGHVRPLAQWAADRATGGITPTYVPIAEWAGVGAQITGHIDLAKPAASAVVTLYGAPGVGKTRFAFELVSASPEAVALVGYSVDASAIEVATELLMSPNTEMRPLKNT